MLALASCSFSKTCPQSWNHRFDFCGYFRPHNAYNTCYYVTSESSELASRDRHIRGEKLHLSASYAYHSRKIQGSRTIPFQMQINLAIPIGKIHNLEYYFHQLDGIELSTLKNQSLLWYLQIREIANWVSIHWNDAVWRVSIRIRITNLRWSDDPLRFI